LCLVEWCNNVPNNSGKGYCRKHYDQIRKYGNILETKTIQTPNDVIMYEAYAEIVLRNVKQEEVARCIVDIGDIDKLTKYKWSLKDNGYVRTAIKSKTMYIHRLLLDLKEGEEVDHINLNKLDNRKQNLRICSHAQNCWNRKNKKSGIVIKEGLKKKYSTRITVNGKTKHLGYFYSEHEALAVREKAERKYFGEYRCKI